MQRLFDAFATLGAGLALVTVAGAPVAIDVVAGRGLRRARSSRCGCSASALLASYAIALGAFALLSLRRQRVLIVVNSAGLLVCVGLALWLTPEHGASGGAVATLVGETLIAVLSFAALRRAGIGVSLRVLPRVALATAAGALPLLVPGLAALPQAVLAAVLFGAAAFALGLVPPEARSALARRRPART